MTDQGVSAVQEFAEYLKGLHRNAGRPSYAKLGVALGYSKSRVGDAFAGHECPTWELAEPLIEYLDGDVKDGQLRWRAARAGRVNESREIAWLTSVADPTGVIEWLGLPALDSEIRRFLAVDPGPSAAVAERAGPPASVKSTWGIVRRVVLNAAIILYGDDLGSWSSHTLLVLDRLVADDKLPRSTRAAAEELHRLNVQADLRAGSAGHVEITWPMALKHLVLGISLAEAIATIPAVRERVQASNTESAEHR